MALRPAAARTSGRGFSLIELVIALSIVAILAAVAIPSYQSHIRRGNRAAAQTEMMSISSLQQQYFLSNRIYTNNLADLGYTLPPDVARNYTVAITVGGVLTGNPLACAASGSGVPSFCLTFTAIGSQVKDGNLGLDSLGSKARNGDTTKWTSSS